MRLGWGTRRVDEAAKRHPTPAMPIRHIRHQRHWESAYARGMDLDARLAAARAHFSTRLAFETDASDVHAALESGEPGFILIDTRSQEAWDQGHVRGAIHMPKPAMHARIPAEIAPGTEIVVYCWGPGCNGATRAGLIITELGYPVKEMIGGFEYWAREGLPVDDASGTDLTRAPDPLTAPRSISCDC